MEKVKINIVPKGKKATCYVSQNDNGRVVRFELFNELLPYVLTGSETITLKVVRPDGAEIVSSVENTEEDYIDAIFTDDMTEIAGVGDCEIKITDGSTVLGSRNFDMNIEIDAYNGRDVIIETASGTLASFNTSVEDNALEYESDIPYSADGYTGLRVINTRTAPVYDKTPYLMRAVTQNANNEMNKIIGGSVDFNQQIQNGNFEDTSHWSVNNVAQGTIAAANNKLTYTVIAASASQRVVQQINLVNGHKYIRFATLTSNKNTRVRLANYYSGALNNASLYDLIANTRTITRSIFISTFSGQVDYYTYTNVLTELSANDTVILENYYLIDLTQMFGSTIADYIYNLETQTADAGVLFFKSLFGADYLPYNTGEILSVKISSHNTTGKNLVPRFRDTEKTQNGITVTPQPDGSIRLHGKSTGQSNYLVSMTDYVKTLPSGIYTFNISNYQNYVYAQIVANGHTLYSYQAKDTYTYNNGLSISRLDIGITAGAYNIPIDITIYPMLVIGSQATDYEPYHINETPLDPDLELRGLLKLDSNNHLYYDGDIYESSGAVTRKYVIVDLSTITDWTQSQSATADGSTCFYTGVIAGISTETTLSNFISNRFTGSPSQYISGMLNNTAILSNGRIYIAVNNNDKSGILLCPRATPTSESADPYNAIEPVETNGLEEFIDSRSVKMPVGRDTLYGTDIEYKDIDFNETIYGGDIDAVNGVLTSRYNADGSVKPTPEIIELDPAFIPVKDGDNNIFNSANGDQTIRYYNQED